jgi:hypothetical protein
VIVFDGDFLPAADLDPGAVFPAYPVIIPRLFRLALSIIVPHSDVAVGVGRV